MRLRLRFGQVRMGMRAPSSPTENAAREHKPLHIVTVQAIEVCIAVKVAPTDDLGRRSQRTMLELPHLQTIEADTCRPEQSTPLDR